MFSCFFKESFLTGAPFRKRLCAIEFDKITRNLMQYVVPNLMNDILPAWCTCLCVAVF